MKNPAQATGYQHPKNANNSVIARTLSRSPERSEGSTKGTKQSPFLSLRETKGRSNLKKRFLALLGMTGRVRLLHGVYTEFI